MNRKAIGTNGLNMIILVVNIILVIAVIWVGTALVGEKDKHEPKLIIGDIGLVPDGSKVQIMDEAYNEYIITGDDIRVNKVMTEKEIFDPEDDIEYCIEFEGADIYLKEGILTAYVKIELGVADLHENVILNESVFNGVLTSKEFRWEYCSGIEAEKIGEGSFYLIALVQDKLISNETAFNGKLITIGEQSGNSGQIESGEIYLFELSEDSYELRDSNQYRPEDIIYTTLEIDYTDKEEDTLLVVKQSLILEGEEIYSESESIFIEGEDYPALLSPDIDVPEGIYVGRYELITEVEEIHSKTKIRKTLGVEVI